MGRKEKAPARQKLTTKSGCTTEGRRFMAPPLFSVRSPAFRQARAGRFLSRGSFIRKQANNLLGAYIATFAMYAACDPCSHGTISVPWASYSWKSPRHQSRASLPNSRPQTADHKYGGPRCLLPAQFSPAPDGTVAATAPQLPDIAAQCTIAEYGRFGLYPPLARP